MGARAVAGCAAAAAWLTLLVTAECGRALAAEPKRGVAPPAAATPDPRTSEAPATPRAEPALDPVAAAGGPSAENSALSYGTVTAAVRKGETTQLELVELFGAPNISSYDSAGVETWVYDRTVTQTQVQASDESAESAQSLGVFFKAFGAGGARSSTRGTSTTRTTTSIRSITVIVKFDKSQVVSDFSVRASYF